MTLQTWLVISAIIGLVIGLTSIFAPQSMLKPFGLRLEGKASVHFAHVAGAGMLSLALVNWVARDYTNSGVIWGVVGANILIHVVTGWVDLRSTLNKTFTPAANGWGSVAFHALFIGVFGYYLLFTR